MEDVKKSAERQKNCMYSSYLPMGKHEFIFRVLFWVQTTCRPKVYISGCYSNDRGKL